MSRQRVTAKRPGPRRRAAPPGRAAGPRRRAAPPGRAAGPRRRAAPPGRAAGPRRRAAPPGPPRPRFNAQLRPPADVQQSMSASAGPVDIARAFVKHYYQLFASDRRSLTGLYRDVSCLSFEGEQFQGAARIVEKLASIGATSIEHNIRTTDVQPAPLPGAIIIGVTGTLKIDGGNHLMFAQTFLLVQNGPGAFYVHNDVFRLIFHV
jgi:hypothetical protein